MNWVDFEKEMRNLATKIDFKPEIIVGIVRGGVIPARMLAASLNLKEMYCLTVEKNGDRRIITTELNKDISDKRVLLVEDMLESGKSLEIVKKYLENKGSIVKTACLYTLPTTQIIPNYYLKKEKKIVSFPWEN